MYVRMYVRIYVCMYAYMHVHMYIIYIYYVYTYHIYIYAIRVALNDPYFNGFVKFINQPRLLLLSQHQQHLGTLPFGQSLQQHLTK